MCVHARHISPISGKKGSARIINSYESSVYYPWVAKTIHRITKDVKVTSEFTEYQPVTIRCMGGIISHTE